ncbi:MAG: cutinase family protein [Nocardioides sp.]
MSRASEKNPPNTTGTWRWRLVVGAVTVALVGAFLVVVGDWGHHAGDAQSAQPTAQKGPSGCADALVLGVNGNHEKPVGGPGSASEPFGKTVNSVVRRVVAKAKRDGRRVVVGGVPLATHTPRAVLREHRKATSHSVDVISRHGVRQWRRPVATGVRAALAQLDKATTKCPDRPVLLVGYAQGAAVVHRVLARAGAEGSLSDLVGGVLISDPDRVAGSAAHPVLGSPAAARRQSGLFPRVLSAQADVPRSQGSYAVWSVCTRHDLVCDPSRARVHDALGLATGYAGSAVLKDVAQQAWHQLALWPVPTPRRLVLTGMVGSPVHTQLSVAPGTRGAVSWSEAAGLPKGVTLSASGLLSGTPKSAGTYAVSYRTSNTDPVTTGHTGSLLVKITPDSVSLSAGGQTTCVTRSDGSARCWGRNDYGQVGDGSTTTRDVPSDVKGGDVWAQVSTSGASTCGVRQDGTLWCWGLNDYGQLGRARSHPVHKPHQVGKNSTWASVTTAWTHSCGIRTNGTLWCWGQNRWGQLGIGTIDRSHGKPQRVGTATDWASVSAAGWHTCATDDTGAAYCWGHNTFGEVGDGTIATRSSPTPVDGGQTWIQLSTAWAQTCGITQTGRLLCWGFNRQGQLGDGTLTNRSEPGPVDSSEAWTQVTTGDGSTCATASDGRLWCWGDNRYGQLGSTADEQPDPTPTLVAALTTPVQLTSAGWLHTCAIPVGAAFTCWGNDEEGQLGDGGTQPYKNLRRGLPEPRHQVELRASDLPADRFLDHASPGKIAAAGLSTRPVAQSSRPLSSGASKDGEPLTPFTMMTMNMLGSQHTAPNGDEPYMAPGRLRAEWASTYFGMRDASMIGMQEPQPDQIVALDSATRGAFKFYPGNSLGYAGAPQSVMWKRADWKLVWHSSISIPFTSGWRPQPIVELQQRSTGAQLYWLNVHFSAQRKGQAQRDKSMKILLKAIKQLKGDHLPILLTGDFNEIAPAFCSITGKTPLVAATGGSNTGGGGTGDGCHLPRGARIDWIFGSRGVFSHTLMDDSAQVRRTTDHHVLSARYGPDAS